MTNRVTNRVTSRVGSAPGRAIRHDQGERLQGGRAGFVSRIAADAVDLLVLQAIYLGVLLMVGVVRYLATNDAFELEAPDLWVTVVAQWLILVLYLGTNWGATGRTVGKSVLGLRVTRADGADCEPVRAFARAVMCSLFFASLLWILVSRRNAALHDLVCSTQVVYAWRG